MVQHIHLSTQSFTHGYHHFHIPPQESAIPKSEVFTLFSHYGDEPLCVCQEFTLCDPQVRKYDI